MCEVNVSRKVSFAANCNWRFFNGYVTIPLERELKREGIPSTDGEGSLIVKRTPGRRKDKRVTTRETHTPPSSHPGVGSPCRSRRALSIPCPPRVIFGPRAVAFLAHSVARALHATFVYVVWWNFVVARAFLRVYTWSGAILSWFARSGSSEAFWLGPPLGS